MVNLKCEKILNGVILTELIRPTIPQEMSRLKRALSLFNGISTFVGYLTLEPFSLKNTWYSLTHCWDNKGVHTFPKGICPNVIPPLEYELAYYDSGVHRFNHYTLKALCIEPYFLRKLIKYSYLLITLK